jgi:AcrR family transcriptional regulator
MPRKPDPILQARILGAARKLWIKGGDKALSMRAVARAARTNTPAIYRRFRNRNEILRALVRFSQQELFEFLKPCRSLEDAGERTFEFALAHPREYQLISTGLLSRINEPQPNFEFVTKRCVEWLGVSPRDATRLVLALWSVVHGTALLFITKAVPKGNDTELRSVLIATLGVLVRNHTALSAKT